MHGPTVRTSREYLTAAMVVAAVLSIAWAAGPKPPATTAQETRTLRLIDDFSGGGKSALDTVWNFVSDRRATGPASAKLEFVEHQGQPCLHLQGPAAVRNTGSLLRKSRPSGPSLQPHGAPRPSG